MERDQIRLELLKLCHRKDYDMSRIIADAKLAEAYVSAIQDEPKVGTVKNLTPNQPKKIDNSKRVDPLS